jgi:aminopeptidase N
MRTLKVLLLLALVAPASASAASPGAPGVGDRLFPTLGNGGYDAKHYDLGLSYGDGQQVPGAVRMRAVATQSLSRLNLDYGGDTVYAVWVDGRRAAWRRDGHELVITPSRPIDRGKTFDVAVTFSGHPLPPGADQTGGGGPSDPMVIGWFTTLDGGSVTSGQPDRGQDVYPVNDHPSDKATYSVVVSAPRGETVGVSGRQTGKRDVRDRTIWSFEMDQPLASQVLQVAVGDYATVPRGTVDGVQLRDLVARRKADIAEPTLSKTPAQLRWIEQRAGRYPFANYGVLAADQYMHYALETQTLSLHPLDLFDPNEYPQEFAEEIILHELAHMWFGDSVTIGSYSDLWLAEGHATWYEQEYVAEFQGGDFEQFMRDEYAIGDQLRAENGPVARPASNDPFVLFSDNVYGGGALVLFALHEKIGDHKWRGLQREWAQRYAGKSVTTEDWIAFVNRYTGRNLTAFLRDWLYGTETPPMPGHPDWETTNTSSASGRSSTATSSAPRANAFRP